MPKKSLVFLQDIDLLRSKKKIISILVKKTSLRVTTTLKKKGKESTQKGYVRSVYTVAVTPPLPLETYRTRWRKTFKKTKKKKVALIKEPHKMTVSIYLKIVLLKVLNFIEVFFFFLRVYLSAK